MGKVSAHLQSSGMFHHWLVNVIFVVKQLKSVQFELQLMTDICSQEQQSSKEPVVNGPHITALISSESSCRKSSAALFMSSVKIVQNLNKFELKNF